MFACPRAFSRYPSNAPAPIGAPDLSLLSARARAQICIQVACSVQRPPRPDVCRMTTAVATTARHTHARAHTQTLGCRKIFFFFFFSRDSSGPGQKETRRGRFAARCGGALRKAHYAWLAVTTLSSAAAANFPLRSAGLCACVQAARAGRKIGLRKMPAEREGRLFLRGPT